MSNFVSGQIVLHWQRRVWPASLYCRFRIAGRLSGAECAGRVAPNVVTSPKARAPSRLGAREPGRAAVGRQMLRRVSLSRFGVIRRPDVLKDALFPFAGRVMPTAPTAWRDDLQARAERAAQQAAARLSAWFGQRVELALVGMGAGAFPDVVGSVSVEEPVTGVRQGFHAGTSGEALMLLASEPAGLWWQRVGALLSGHAAEVLPVPEEALLELGGQVIGVYVAALHDAVAPRFLPPTLLDMSCMPETSLRQADLSRAALNVIGVRVSAPAAAFDAVLVVFPGEV